MAPVTLGFTLTVSNGAVTTPAATTVVVNPGIGAPTANAGAAQTVTSAAAVTLTGTATDPNLPVRTLTYGWTQTAGTTVTLTNASAAAATFTAPTVASGTAPKTLSFTLTVNNGALTSTATTTVTVTSGMWVPAANTSWDWQLTTPVNTAANVTVYEIDMFENSAAVMAALHAQGRKVICYINAGSWENWRPDAASFPASVKGAKYQGFANEKWLDIRAWPILGPIMTARFNLAKSKGCDGIEPDNIDGYDTTAHASTGFPLTYSDQKVYNMRLSALAHSLGLSIGLKNDINQAADLQPAFDWALSEQCFQYGECNFFKPFTDAGKAVFEVEYDRAPATFCPQANALNFNAIAKHPSLDSYRAACR
jgi:hypothetical protein